MEFYLTYPDYNTKAFTVSYDDGTIQDKKVMSLAKKIRSCRDLCTEYPVVGNLRLDGS